jgi:hypothetical protein
MEDLEIGRRMKRYVKCPVMDKYYSILTQMVRRFCWKKFERFDFFSMCVFEELLYYTPFGACVGQAVCVLFGVWEVCSDLRYGYA